MKRKVLVMISPASATRVAGVARYAREHNWHLMIQDRLGHRPLAWNGDGIVATLRSDEASVATITQLKKRGIPVVDVTMSRPDIKVPRVTSDHAEIGRLAARHFEERNFRNVAWFSTGWGNVHNLRYGGLTERSAAAKWIVEESVPKSRRNDFDTFMRWMAKTLRETPKPVAALTYDEADAARLLDAAERLGVSVPEELAILSIGNDPIICENQSVPLSSIDQDLERGGYEAAAMLDRLMDGDPPPDKPVLIPPDGNMPSPLHRHHRIERPYRQKDARLHRRESDQAIRRGANSRRARRQPQHPRQAFPRRPEPVDWRGNLPSAPCVGQDDAPGLRQDHLRDSVCGGILHAVASRQHL